MEMNVDKEMDKEVKRLAGKDVALTNLTILLKKASLLHFAFYAMYAMRGLRH